ncbi:acriflavin resistance protein [Stanieria cyanosphaera PCC 7437]|uniref:Acriflavin resistance protein n=1 Tax=Stanieria cyanosphaera (strain ATCC 29371 / PCC 7437) TaxID=111780 RepID=K9XS07_STAC7|nr:efflux RND transporter permease subunit [Stanieria cyanosphaera]AFZ35313.1 acriflavin resistance protein [Stanieria cyanosphaera PCC 7437]
MVQSQRKPNLRESLNLSKLALAYPWLTLCLWLIVAVAGIFAYSSLKYALFPDITFPVVIVQAETSLQTTLATEQQLTTILEQPLQSLTGLDQLNSVTYPGRSIITHLFYPGQNLASVQQEVEAKLTEVSLPPDTDVKVIPFNLNESTVVSYGITSQSKSLTELIPIVQTQMIPTIKSIPGVLRVDLLGDLSSQELNQSSETSLPNHSFPSLVHLNGDNALAIAVVKRSDANTLEVVKQVQAAIATIQPSLKDIQITLAATQADYIREATQATIEALWGAIVLAVVVIFGCLRNWAATIITALAIPISLLGTFIIMAIAGFNLETITLLALALTIGIVVDDAIVDVENIVRYLEAGSQPRQAVTEATQEIGFTVSVTTLTIVAVFLPVAFMGGTVGQFFKPFGLTVAAAVITSLLVARTLSPVLALYWLRSKNNRGNNHGDFNSKLISYYRRLLQWSLQHRKTVIAIALITMVAGLGLIPLVPKGFIPQLDRGEFNIIYTTPLPKLDQIPQQQETEANTSNQAETNQNFAWLQQLAQSPARILLNKTLRVGKEIEQVTLADPEVQSVFTVAGLQGKPNQGKLYVKLNPNRTLTTAEIQAQLRNKLPTIPGVQISIEDIPFVDIESKQNLQIALAGDDLKALTQTAKQLQKKVETLPGFADITLSNESENIDSLTKIERRNGQRVVFFNANLSQGKTIGDATEELEEIAKPLLPQGVTLQLSGDAALSSDVLGSFAETLIFAIACMLLLLILLFGRLLEPIVVALCLPLALIGAMLALLFTQNDFGMIAVIGTIFLVGLLDKNAILLMDYINQLRQTGLTRTEAILKTGIVRLRPIIMTTGSTVLGMLPIALGWGAGAELRQPMAVTIIGGLITSTLLSLIVVPVVYTLLEDFWVQRVHQKRS